MKSNDKKVYVIRPDMKCYYGIVVNKDTKIEFKNEFVEQKIENMILKSTHVLKTERFKSTTNLELKLEEGEVLLLEEENRGYFMPKDVLIGTVEEAIEDYKFLQEQINKIDKE